MNKLNWLDRSEYPFISHYLPLPMGNLHYIDEGQGETILLLHGNPTWSFLYRHAIKGLSPQYRTIAPDYIGFGLSDKPRDWSYLPQAQAQNIEHLIERLRLKDITLVVQDWGGPIGLSYAVNHPENVKRMVIMNTWMWRVNGEQSYVFFSGFMGGVLGRYLVRQHNFFAKHVMKSVTGDKSKLDAATHRHYIQVSQHGHERKGQWVFPKQIIAAGDWLEDIWSRRSNLRDIPTLLLWGMKDPSFPEKALQRFEGPLPHHRTVRLPHTGHFVQEELKSDLARLIGDFMVETQTNETKRIAS